MTEREHVPRPRLDMPWDEWVAFLRTLIGGELPHPSGRIVRIVDVLDDGTVVYERVTPQPASGKT